MATSRCVCRNIDDCDCAFWYDQLEKEGLGELDHVTDDGTITVSTKGSGVAKNALQARRFDELSQETARREAVLNNHRFGDALHKKVYILHAEGKSSRAISKAIGGMAYRTVQRIIARTELEYAAMNAAGMNEQGILQLLKQANPELICLFLELSERMVYDPAPIVKAMNKLEDALEIKKDMSDYRRGEDWYDSHEDEGEGQ